MVVNETENKNLDHAISVIKKISEYCHLQTDETKLNRAPETKTASGVFCEEAVLCGGRAVKLTCF